MRSSISAFITTFFFAVYLGRAIQMEQSLCWVQIDISKISGILLGIKGQAEKEFVKDYSTRTDSIDVPDYKFKVAKGSSVSVRQKLDDQ